MTTRRNSLALAIPLALIALLTVVAAALAADGGSESKPQVARRPAAFAWLHPAVAPADWTTVRLPGSAARNLHVRWATGSCVIDSYLTTTGNRYREIACLVAGRSSTTVIVAAAPPSRWNSYGPLLRRAVNAFTT